jgi:NAD(P)H-quinone oxidoreductase subunit M
VAIARQTTSSAATVFDPLQLNSAKNLYTSKLMQLKSTTRHIRIYTAILENDELVPSNDQLTIDIDPDNELNWNDESVKQVYAKFDQLVDSYEGEDLTEYNLRRIGSELEHLVRSFLQKGQISYNLNSRAVNYSMGLPQVDSKIHL